MSTNSIISSALPLPALNMLTPVTSLDIYRTRLEWLNAYYQCPIHPESWWPYRVSYQYGDHVWVCVRTEIPERNLLDGDWGEWRYAEVMSTDTKDRKRHLCKWRDGRVENIGLKSECGWILPDNSFVRVLLLAYGTLDAEKASEVQDEIKHLSDKTIAHGSDLIRHGIPIPRERQPIYY